MTTLQMSAYLSSKACSDSLLLLPHVRPVPMRELLTAANHIECILSNIKYSETSTNE